MVRKIRYALLGLLVLSVCGAGAMVGFAENAPAEGNAQLYKDLNLFGSVLARVRSDYVEKPDDNKLIEDAINGMLAALDPHSTYMNGKEFREMQVQTRGEFGGLGIEVTMENGVDQSGRADRGYAGRQGWTSERRSHRRARQGADRRPHAGPGGGEDARPDQCADHADDQAQGHRQRVRRHHDARRDPHQAGEVPGRGRRRLCARHQLQRADHLRAGEGDLGAEADDRSEAQGLHHRFAQRSRRPAGSGHLGVRFLSRPGRHRAHQGAQSSKRRSAPMRDRATSPTASRSWC